MQIVGAILEQVITVFFYLVLIVVAITLGIYFRKRKNLKDSVEKK